MWYNINNFNNYSPLDQFEVTNLIGLSAPSLGYLNFSYETELRDQVFFYLVILTVGILYSLVYFIVEYLRFKKSPIQILLGIKWIETFIALIIICIIVFMPGLVINYYTELTNSSDSTAWLFASFLGVASKMLIHFDLTFNCEYALLDFEYNDIAFNSDKYSCTLVTTGTGSRPVWNPMDEGLNGDPGG